jgi:hypothetical protein
MFRSAAGHSGWADRNFFEVEFPAVGDQRIDNGEDLYEATNKAVRLFLKVQPGVPVGVYTH